LLSLLACWFLAWLIHRTWRWRRHVPSKCQLTFNGLHGVISEKIKPFIIAAVITSNPAYKLGMVWETTACSRALLAELTVAQLVEQLSALYKTRRFIIVCMEPKREAAESSPNSGTLFR
jgi:hypothetical protein